MTLPLEDMKVAVLATDGVEQVELEAPVQALRQAGAKVELVSIAPGEIQAVHHLDKGDTFSVDRVVSDASAHDYAMLVLPGGVANSDALRTNADAVRFVREFMESDKPVAAICHGPWLLVEADALKGRTLTSWPSLRTDIRNAGGSWVDKPVQLDQKLITSRKPDDLRAFCAKLIDVLARARANARVDEASEESFPASDPPAWSPSAIGPRGAEQPESPE